MAVVSIDLAARSYRDNGLVVLRAGSASIDCEIIPLAERLSGRPRADELAAFLASLAERVSASCIVIDGPQAWKAPDNGLPHQRRCEKLLHTPGKTGEPGTVKPRTWTRFVEFSVALFAALEERGWPRLRRAPDTRDPIPRATLESFPSAAWRSLGLPPLPSKAKCRPVDIHTARLALEKRFPIRLSREPSHDELQALIAGLAGVALEQRQPAFVDLVGEPPRRLAGIWREGFIASPTLPPRVLRVRRLRPA